MRKYFRAFYFLMQVGLVLLALLFGLRMVGAIFAVVTPILDAVIAWMYDHALVGGLMVGISFLIWWFGDECDRQKERERKDKCSMF